LLQADVLVNSTNQQLDLRVGMTSRQLLRAAGEDIQNQCATMYPDGLSWGQVAITQAGDIASSKLIFHGMLPAWDGGKGQSEQVRLSI